jgi:hypothetical protein
VTSIVVKLKEMMPVKGLAQLRKIVQNSYCIFISLESCPVAASYGWNHRGLRGVNEG